MQWRQNALFCESTNEMDVNEPVIYKETNLRNLRACLEQMQYILKEKFPISNFQLLSEVNYCNSGPKQIWLGPTSRQADQLVWSVWIGRSKNRSRARAVSVRTGPDGLCLRLTLKVSVVE